MLTRRRILSALIAAPAIVKASNLMMIFPVPTDSLGQLQLIGEFDMNAMARIVWKTYRRTLFDPGFFDPAVERAFRYDGALIEL